MGEVVTLEKKPFLFKREVTRVEYFKVCAMSQAEAEKQLATTQTPYKACIGTAITHISPFETTRRRG